MRKRMLCKKIMAMVMVFVIGIISMPLYTTAGTANQMRNSVSIMDYGFVIEADNRLEFSISATTDYGRYVVTANRMLGTITVVSYDTQGNVTSLETIDVAANIAQAKSQQTSIAPFNQFFQTTTDVGFGYVVVPAFTDMWGNFHPHRAQYGSPRIGVVNTNGFYNIGQLNTTRAFMSTVRELQQQEHRIPITMRRDLAFEILAVIGFFGVFIPLPLVAAMMAYTAVVSGLVSTANLLFRTMNPGVVAEVSSNIARLSVQAEENFDNLRSWF